MRYLYADSTTFPLPQNFLATLCAGTDACVAILKAEALVDECNRVTREAEVKATRELAQVSALAHRVDAALGGGAEPVPADAKDGPGASRSANPGDLALAKIREQAWATLDQSRGDVLKSRDARITAAINVAPRSLVLPALSQFMATHELPDTAWGIRWTAGLGGASTRAELYARTPFGLEATFEVAIPTGHVWARPAQVRLLGMQASVTLVKKPLVGKARPTLIKLDEYYVTHVVLTADRASMRLSKNSKNPAESIEFVFGGEGSAEVTATGVDKANYPLGEGAKLCRADAAGIHRLWNRVTTTLGSLVVYRTRATTAKLGGVLVSEVPRPEVIAAAVVRALAPHVREIAARTTTPRELALKRELGDGCREELFITYDTVLERAKDLSAAHQEVFDMYGLREPEDAQGAVVWRLPVVRPPRLKAG